MSKKNPVAKSLANRLYQPKVVKPKKGKGSYTRKSVKPLSTGGTLKTKIKKVAKGLEKASKSHAKQAKTLNSIKLKQVAKVVLRVSGVLVKLRC